MHLFIKILPSFHNLFFSHSIRVFNKQTFSTVFNKKNWTFQDILESHDFTEVVHSSPAIKSIMIVVGHMATGSKYMFNSNQVSNHKVIM